MHIPPSRNARIQAEYQGYSRAYSPLYPPHRALIMLQTPKGINAIATITELRSKTSELVAEAERSSQGVLVVKNNDPYAVLVSYDRYTELLDG